MSSPQASTVVGSDDEEPAQVPSPNKGLNDDRKFVKELLEACSNKQKKYNFEDYVVEKGRGLEDVHPKTRQKCYVNREEVLHCQWQGWVGKSRYRGRRTATHNLLVFESMLRGHHAIAADSESVRPGPGAGGGEGDCSDEGGGGGRGGAHRLALFLLYGRRDGSRTSKRTHCKRLNTQHLICLCMPLRF